MENLVAKIKAELNVFVENADAQVEKGNKAAGARARKAALELMKDLKEFRKVSVEESKKESFPRAPQGLSRSDWGLKDR